MSDVKLLQSRIAGGTWQGILKAGKERPEVEVTHLSVPVGTLSVQADGEDTGRWRVALPIPVELLSDGVQTFVLRAKESGQTLGTFSVVTGVPLDGDIRCEIDLLRAELDLLKKAFRRHCVETSA